MALVALCVWVALGAFMVFRAVCERRYRRASLREVLPPKTKQAIEAEDAEINRRVQRFSESLKAARQRLER